MKLLFSLIAAIISMTSSAQNRVFMGRVMDKQKQGIPFAVVEAKDMNQGVYCDENGVFAFTGNADVIKTLVIFCLGYEKKEISTEILPLDSIMVELDTKVAALGVVAIKRKKGVQAMGTLGKNKSQLNYDGDCYRYYGSETAIRLKADTSRNGVLKSIYVFITDEGTYNTKFRVHVYEWDSVPTKEITNSSLIVQAESGNSWVKVDVSHLKIPINLGVFLSVEWVSGFGNSQRALQSDKNPEVKNYNGQVLGLTADYGKPSKTYSRKPFNKKWIYYDAPEAQRKGGYFLNPMIYCTYTYVK